MDPDQAWQNVGPDLDPICLTLRWYSWKNLKKVGFEKNQQTTKEHEKLPSSQRVNILIILSGRVLDSRQRGHGFDPHWRHCVVSLSKTHLSLLSTGSTQEDPSQHNWKIVDLDVKDQIKQKKKKNKKKKQ